jgi:hypothetical protein
MSPSRTTLALTLCALAASLGGCHRKQSLTATPGEKAQITSPAAPAASPTIPGAHLWRIEVVSEGKVASQQDICADSALRASFSRPAPELRGQPCVQVGKAVEKDGTYAVRCNIDNQQYRVGSVTKGDPARDFTVDMAVAEQGRTGPSFEQVRHYRLLGPCPAGWVIADAAAPGDTRVTNALTGGARTSQTPAP